MNVSVLDLPETLPTVPRVSLFGFQLDPLDLNAAVAQIYHWITTRSRRGCFVVTPNVDHAVQLQENAALREAYSHAALVLADGLPVVLAARLLHRPIPERVAGSDLAPALFNDAHNHGGLKVYLLGSAPGVALRAARNIMAIWPDVQIVGTDSPPHGFEHDEIENECILARIAAAQPDILLVGLGAPKQELWVDLNRDRIEAAVTLCAGATIDFLAGEKTRAPLWMRRSGLEWLHRVLSEPRRLYRRYARDAWKFPQLVLGEWQAARKLSASQIAP